MSLWIPGFHPSHSEVQCSGRGRCPERDIRIVLSVYDQFDNIGRPVASMWKTSSARRWGGRSRVSIIRKNPVFWSFPVLGRLEGGELGLEETLGLLEVDQGPGAEPVAAGDLGELGGVQSAAVLDLLEQHAGRAGSIRARGTAAIDARSDVQAGSPKCGPGRIGPGRHHLHDHAVHVRVARPAARRRPCGRRTSSRRRN